MIWGQFSGRKSRITPSSFTPGVHKFRENFWIPEPMIDPMWEGVVVIYSGYIPVTYRLYPQNLPLDQLAQWFKTQGGAVYHGIPRELFGVKWESQPVFSKAVGLMENAKEKTAAFCSFSAKKINQHRPKISQVHPNSSNKMYQNVASTNHPTISSGRFCNKAWKHVWRPPTPLTGGAGSDELSLNVP